MPHTLLFVEANTTGSGMLALQKALDFGMHPVFFTNDPQRYLGLTEIKCPVCVCDTNHLETLQAAIERYVSEHDITGVITMSEFYLETVAALSTRYQLPGNSLEAVRKARNKLLTRRLLAQEGISQPRFMGIDNVQSLDAALEHIGLPCIIKPVDDSGSTDVLLCQTREQALVHATKILTTPINVRGQRTAGFALVEEYLEAPEFSVEIFSTHDQTFCIGITQKTATSQPYFVETRHLFPASLTEEQTEQIYTTVLRTLSLLNIRYGATHTEVKWTQQGCSIIEVNARLAGGMIPELIRLVTGIDLLEQQLCCFMGRHTSIEHTLLSHGVAGIQFFLAEKTGKLHSITGFETVKQLNTIVAAKLTTMPGKFVQLPQHAHHRLGYVIAYSKDTATVIEQLQAAIEQVHFIIQ